MLSKSDTDWSSLLWEFNPVSMGTILLIVLVVFLLGGFTGFRGGPGYGFGHGLNGGIGLLLLVVLVLVLLGKL